ncbi:MAG: hypothetical protein N4A33_04290, partial [Bacteriovoracaceae bacterium]|nr:hypothetical protein [Bacteriovoracaceae bacterium]
WGHNAYGQLGIGSTTTKGDGGGEMGNSLPFLNLGTGINSTYICAGIYHTCSLFDNGKVKCWGDNIRVGNGDTNDVGNHAADMGDNLQFLDFGAGRTVKKLACGGYHTCAILDNNDLKCFGESSDGQTGQGATGDIGDAAGEMGDILQPVNLGTNRYAVDIYLGHSHTCAVLDNATIKCFGRNDEGQLGLGNRTDVGSFPGTMGDALPTVEFK